ncbi:MAG: ABC transporter substrate-binding protein [Gammaproteobacteria bacterium]|nr:ABC transporter substrate-binding protein [Gammaproteobacteria bacterium]MBU1554250.1 ABC transporter substrate-binding protein [Gammaproteobacteria bacterium]MBU2070194.1 ABC transporter substrate-binding protein [Gammaproteobacteria bacterium]MBU2183555.1 ABC transporter substrate-binding protein [Gammaproteobacteria bacterium]MBU2204706.1 ABC transporter substrate-binding protein [Gammaproteobacteria bacterium]
MRSRCLVLLFWAQCLVAADPEPIRAVVSETNTPPYAIFNAAKALQAGLSKDIIDELGLSLGRTVSYLNLPRSRVELWLQDGKADLACFLSPDWIPEPDSLQWTDPLFSTQQLLVRRKDNAIITAVQHLAGKRVGTTRGFTYPELEQVFRLGDVIRDDAHSLESNLLRLKQGRLDVVMTVDLSYHFYLKTTGDDSFAADPLWSEPPAVYCALSRHNPQQSAVLKAGFAQLVQSGFIQQRLAFYMGSGQRTVMPAN